MNLSHKPCVHPSETWEILEAHAWFPTPSPNDSASCSSRGPAVSLSPGCIRIRMREVRKNNSAPEEARTPPKSMGTATQILRSHRFFFRTSTRVWSVCSWMLFCVLTLPYSSQTLRHQKVDHVPSWTWPTKLAPRANVGL